MDWLEEIGIENLSNSTKIVEVLDFLVEKLNVYTI